VGGDGSGGRGGGVVGRRSPRYAVMLLARAGGVGARSDGTRPTDPASELRTSNVILAAYAHTHTRVIRIHSAHADPGLNLRLGLGAGGNPRLPTNRGPPHQTLHI